MWKMKSLNSAHEYNIFKSLVAIERTPNERTLTHMKNANAFAYEYEHMSLIIYSQDH